MTNFLNSSFRRVLNVVFFLMGYSPASEFYMPTFRKTLSVPSSWLVGVRRTCLPMKMGQCSEMPAYKIQTPENKPKESLKH
jgi:hypothetical protein